MADVVRKEGARLAGAVHPILRDHLAPGPLRHLRRNYRAFHAFDKAHTVGLVEERLIPLEVGRAILSGLREMEAEGIEAARDALGGGRHSGEAYLTAKLGADVAGWINLARSSGDLDAVAWKFTLRERLPALAERANDLRRILIDRAGENVDTVMPGMSLGQHAQCTSLGHALLAWEVMLSRDVDRIQSVFDECSASPAGSCIMTGSTFPISRERVAELLGFQGVDTNTRDAVMSIDSFLHAQSVVTVLIANAMRIANDLYLWTMSEFRFVELADQYCGTSSIMPQKKNSFSLSWIRGQSSLSIGRLCGAFALAKNETGGLEDAIMGPWECYEVIDDAEAMLELLTGIIETMTIRTEHLAQQAPRGWTQATDLAAMLTRRAGLSWREAHHTVATLVRLSAARGLSSGDVTPDVLDEAGLATVGRPLAVTREAIEGALDAAGSLRARDMVTGSPGPRQMEDQLRKARAKLGSDRDRVHRMAGELNGGNELLEQAIDALVAVPRVSTAPSP